MAKRVKKIASVETFSISAPDLNSTPIMTAEQLEAEDRDDRHSFGEDLNGPSTAEIASLDSNLDALWDRTEDA